MRTLQPASAPQGQGALSWRIYLALTAIAFLPRIALAMAFLHAPIGLDDMFQYDMLARSLATGRGYRWYGRADVARLRPYLETFYGINIPTDQAPEEGLITTFRAPGYPLLLAGVYVLFGLGNRFAAARLVQVVLSTGLAPGTALLTVRLGLSRRAASVAGAIVALYPILWLYPLGLASENIFFPLVLLGLLSLLAASRTARWLPAVGAGLVLGAATLTRGALAAFLPLAGLWLWRSSPSGVAAVPTSGRFDRRARSRQVAALTLAGAAVLVPWMVRNSLILHRPAFIENSVGYNLFVGHHPQGDGGLDVRVSVIPLGILDDGARDRWTTAQALQFIRDDPLRALLLLPRRLAYFWGLEDRELTYFYANDFFGPISQPWLAMAYLLLVSPLLAVGLSAPFGMALATDTHSRNLALALIGAALLAYVPILAEPRFHLPLVPVLAAYAAQGWRTPAVLRALGQRLRRRDPAVILAAAAGVLLVFLWAWDLSLEWAKLMAVMSPGGNALGLAY